MKHDDDIWCVEENNQEGKICTSVFFKTKESAERYIEKRVDLLYSIFRESYNVQSCFSKKEMFACVETDNETWTLIGYKTSKEL